MSVVTAAPASAPAQRVTFYRRGAGERTFTTDPQAVADGFLSHRLGRKALATRHSRRYLARFLAEYLTWKGAAWARLGDSDPANTRASFDAVYHTVVARLEIVDPPDDERLDAA